VAGSACRQHSQTLHRSGSEEVESRRSELAVPAHVLCDRQLQAGADPKSVQGQMRHSRISTTMDIYAQFVPEGQKKAARKLTEYVVEQAKAAGPLLVQ